MCSSLSFGDRRNRRRTGRAAEEGTFSNLRHLGVTLGPGLGRVGVTLRRDGPVGRAMGNHRAQAGEGVAGHALAEVGRPLVGQAPPSGLRAESGRRGRGSGAGGLMDHAFPSPTSRPTRGRGRGCCARSALPGVRCPAVVAGRGRSCCTAPPSGPARCQTFVDAGCDYAERVEDPRGTGDAASVHASTRAAVRVHTDRRPGGRPGQSARAWFRACAGFPVCAGVRADSASWAQWTAAAADSAARAAVIGVGAGSSDPEACRNCVVLGLRGQACGCGPGTGERVSDACRGHLHETGRTLRRAP
ncbi:hypothetical protein FHX34_105441 [Actinoplanes teichomyceticus]|uniref:Uncharacterized protein n=1 Tax=Actinoplanes teichomyceticus TaxID=1867 RepID=A0A561VLT7_ACTTI|nr:hypothetical protein FHX34_105441 [Actinoplanes teichomyceticus]